MQARQLRTVYRSQPFKPFVMQVADGRSVRVHHPELMALSPTGRSAVVYAKDDGFDIIDVPSITGIEVPNGKPQARRRKR